MTNPNYSVIIRVARDQDLLRQIGTEIYFDLVNHDRVSTFNILGTSPFYLFKEKIAKEFGISVQFQRFWRWGKRENCTYRPVEPLTPVEEWLSVGLLKELSNKMTAELDLFLEVELGLVSPALGFQPMILSSLQFMHRHPVSLPVKSKEDILLFFKLYNPEKGELRYVGRLFVKTYSKPSDILGKINNMAGFPPDEQVNLYEEVRFYPSVMCELVDKAASFRANEIEDGDIICFQKSLVQSAKSCRYPTVPLFLEHIHDFQEMEAEHCPSVVSPLSSPSPDTYSASDTDKFVLYFDGLDEFIGSSEASPSSGGPNLGTRTSQTIPLAPSSEEVENAKQSLKECLRDLFNLDMKERLASALSTLSAAEAGLSTEQRRSVLEFQANFDDIVSDYVTFELEYKLKKLDNDRLFSAMKKKRTTHLSYKELSEKLTREEEKLKMKLEETRCRKAKLVSDWEALMAESEETKLKYVSSKSKLAEVETRKRTGDEKLSRSSAAWSSLKTQFL